MGILAILALAGLVSTAVGGAVNYGLQKDSQAWSSSENQATRNLQKEENALSREFNAAEAQKQRNFLLNLDSTKYQRQVEDMKAAGLNVGALGASPGGSPAASSASSGMSGIGSGIGAGLNSFNMNVGAMMSSVFSVLNYNKEHLANAYIANSNRAARQTAREISKGSKNNFDMNDFINAIDDWGR